MPRVLVLVAACRRMHRSFIGPVVTPLFVVQSECSKDFSPSSSSRRSPPPHRRLLTCRLFPQGFLPLFTRPKHQTQVFPRVSNFAGPSAPRSRLCEVDEDFVSFFLLLPNFACNEGLPSFSGFRGPNPPPPRPQRAASRPLRHARTYSFRLPSPNPGTEN